MAERFDVAIVGGGIAGTTLAALLGQAGVSVALIERQAPAKLHAETYDGRTTAITAGSRRVLEPAGLWDALRPNACHIADIRVADESSPLFLHFDSTEVGDDPFGWIVENRLIRRAFHERVSAIKSVTRFAPAAVSSIDTSGPFARLMLEDGREIAAELIVGADGRDSFVRTQAGIGTIGWEYDQHAIVTTIGHTLDHQNIAVENFLPPGPFAILPMTDDDTGIHRSSIVWTDRKDAVPGYMALGKKEFEAELQRRTGEWLGKIHEIGRRMSYPLQLRHAKRYTATRIALIADAAHVIHPIAGQGLNLGMRDIALLAELVIGQRRVGLDVGDKMMLQRYARGRRADNVAFSVATDVLDRLFSNSVPPVRAARRAGLGAINRAAPLRRFFMRRAMGAAGALSKLGRGEEI